MNPDVILIQRRELWKLHRVKLYNIGGMVAPGEPMANISKSVFYLRFHIINATNNITTAPTMMTFFLS